MNTRYMPSYIAMVREKLMRSEPTADNLVELLKDDKLTSCILSAKGLLEANHPQIVRDLLPVVAAYDEDYFVDALSIAAWTGSETATLAYTSLSPARSVTMKVTDANRVITDFHFTLVGKDQNGTAQTKVFVFEDGLEQETDELWSGLTSFTNTSITGTPTGCVLNIGFGSKAYKSLVLPTWGKYSEIDLSNCKDRFNMDYFRDIVYSQPADLEVYYPVTEGTVGSTRRNATLNGNLLSIGYDAGLTAGNYVGITWGKKHTLSDTQNTIPARFDEALVHGGLAFAYLYLSDYKVNNINIGANVATTFSIAGSMRLQEFKEMIVTKTKTLEDCPRS